MPPTRPRKSPTAKNTGSSTGHRLVGLPEGSPVRGWLRATVLALVFGLVAGTGMVDAYAWVADPTPLKQLLRGKNLLDRFAHGRLARNLEKRYQDHSVVRRYALPVYTLGSYGVLRDLGPEILVGSEGWLFMKDRVAVGNDPDGIPRAVQWMADLQDRAAQLDLRLIFVPIPRKSALLPQYLPAEFHDSHHLDTRLADAVRRRGLDVVDLLPRLRHMARVEHPYFPTDTHWTGPAVHEAADEVARQTGLWKPPRDRRSYLQLFEVPAAFDLLRFRGGREAMRFAEMLRTSGPWPIFRHRRFIVRDRAPTPSLGVRRVVGATLDWDAPVPALLAGSSFSTIGFAPLISHFIQTPMVDISRAGCPPTVPLRTFIADRRAHGRPLPKTLFIEIPVSQLFSKRLGTPNDIIPLTDSEVALSESRGFRRYCQRKPEGHRRGQNLVFDDGFETGDLGAWQPVGHITSLGTTSR